MKRVLVFGNSGSGKSTLAKKLCARDNLAHLDLDILAWEETAPPTRKPIHVSAKLIRKFIAENPSWVIEGCYTDLLEIASEQASEIYFLKLPVQDCIRNAMNRPWEPHKYPSREEQDSNINMLIDWISQYSERVDTFSQAEHTRLYEEFSGTKHMFTSNVQAT